MSEAGGLRGQQASDRRKRYLCLEGSLAELGLGTLGPHASTDPLSLLRWCQLPSCPGVVCVLWEPADTPGPRQASADESPRYRRLGQAGH